MYVDNLSPISCKAKYFDVHVNKVFIHSFIHSSLKTDLGHDYFLSITVLGENNFTVACRDKTDLRIQSTSQNPQTRPIVQNHFQEPNSRFFEFWEVVFILGRVLDLRSVLKFHRSFRVIPG